MAIDKHVYLIVDTCCRARAPSPLVVCHPSYRAEALAKEVADARAEAETRRLCLQQAEAHEHELAAMADAHAQALADTRQAADASVHQILVLQAPSSSNVTPAIQVKCDDLYC